MLLSVVLANVRRCDKKAVLAWGQGELTLRRVLIVEERMRSHDLHTYMAGAHQLANSCL
jgi:hypothetical protein